MDAIDIIRDALHFPIDNAKNWLIIALLFLINGVIKQLAINLHNDIANIIFGIISLILYIIILGVSLDITRSTINGSNQIPMINPKLNIIDGLKSFVISVIYSIIPLVLSLIISIPFGLYDKLFKIVDSSVNLTTNSSLNATGVVTAIPTNLLADLFVSIGIVTIISFILYVFFAFLSDIAIAKLADTNSILEALNLPSIIAKISSIGWASFVFYFVLLLITVIVLGMLAGLVALIPYIGAILETFLVESFIIVFMSRATGLIYNEG